MVGVNPFASVLKCRADGFVALTFIKLVFVPIVQAISADVFGQCQQCAWGGRKGVGVYGVQGNAQIFKLGPKRLGAAAKQGELVRTNPVLAPRLGCQHHHRVHGDISRRRGEKRGMVSEAQVASKPDKRSHGSILARLRLRGLSGLTRAYRVQ